MRFCIASMCCAVMLFTNGSWADDAGDSVIHGAGGRSCGEYVRVVDGSSRSVDDVRDSIEMLQWMEGYLSYFNSSVSDTYDTMGGTDAQGIKLWLYNYCKSHPLEYFKQSVDSLIVTLWPLRLSHKPRP